MRTHKPDELRHLISQALTFPKSRRELTRRIIENPDATIPSIVQIGSEDFSVGGRVVSEALRKAIERSMDFNLAWHIYREIPKKSAHFTGLAIRLCCLFLEVTTGSKTDDLLLKATLLHNLGEHLRDAYRPQDGLEASKKAVAIFAQLTGEAERHREKWVTALVMLAKHYSEAGNATEAVKTASAAVREARKMRTVDGNYVLAESMLTHGSCLSSAGMNKEALSSLQDGHRFFSTFAGKSDRDIANHAQANLLLGDALYKLSRYVEAQPFAENGRSLYLQKVAEDRGTFFEGYFWSLIVCGLLAEKLGDPERSRQMHQEAAHYFSDLSVVYPEEFTKPYAWRLISLSANCIGNSDLAHALLWGRMAVKKAVAKLPRARNRDWLLIGVAKINLATVFFARRNWKKSLETATEARGAILKLKADHPSRQKLLYDVRAQIRVLRDQLRRRPIRHE